MIKNESSFEFIYELIWNKHLLIRLLVIIFSKYIFENELFLIILGYCIKLSSFKFKILLLVSSFKLISQLIGLIKVITSFSSFLFSL